MGFLNFIPKTSVFNSFGITIDNNANILIGSNPNKVNGFANIVIGDNEVDGAANILFGSGNDVHGNANIIAGGLENNINGNANILSYAVNNNVDGNANILTGIAGMHLTGNDQAFLERFEAQNFTPFVDINGVNSPKVTIEAPATDNYDGGTIVLGSDIAQNAADGADGADILVGGDNGNSFSGGDGNDILVGGAGEDTLSGGDGEDILVGGEGNDILSGGEGTDIFGFGPSDGNDRITDFDVTEDILDFKSKGQFGTMTELLANSKEATQSGVSGTLINMPGSGTLFLDEVSLSELAQAEIQLS